MIRDDGRFPRRGREEAEPQLPPEEPPPPVEQGPAESEGAGTPDLGPYTPPVPPPPPPDTGTTLAGSFVAPGTLPALAFRSPAYLRERITAPRFPTALAGGGVTPDEGQTEEDPRLGFVRRIIFGLTGRAQ